MADYPETVQDFRAWFPDDAACRAYLERIRWPEGPRCGCYLEAPVWAMKAPIDRCARGGHDFTVTVGTLFTDTHLPLRLWLEVLVHISC
jgi:hypothetical protein